MLSSPDIWAGEGYISDSTGTRPLRNIEVAQEGEGPEGLGAEVTYRLIDVSGQSFTIYVDMARRRGRVMLMSQKPEGRSYTMIENFCPGKLVETGETGHGLVELGRSSDYGSLQ